MKDIEHTSSGSGRGIPSAGGVVRNVDGRAAYEADVAKRPLYHDGAKRKEWEQLGDLERWSWGRS